jgi:hypothetical protein
MNSKSIMLALSFVLTISTSAQAYLVPGGQTGSGKPSNDPNRPGQYNPPPNNGGGGHGGPGGGHGGGYNPPPRPGNGGGYYPPSQPYYPPPRPHNPPPRPGNGGGYYPPSQPYYPPTQPYYPPAPRPNYPPPPPPTYYPPTSPYYPPAPSLPGYGQRIVQQVSVGRSVANEMFQLSYYAQLNQYAGWQVTAVRAVTRPNSPYRTVAQLMTADRCVLASEVNPGYDIDLYPNTTVYAGSQDLYLYIEGSTYIETIEVELLRR